MPKSTSWFGAENLSRNPVYLEKCKDCDHTQAWHIGTQGPYLSGHMVPCRQEGCECQKWSPTWAVK